MVAEFGTPTCFTVVHGVQFSTCRERQDVWLCGKEGVHTWKRCLRYMRLTRARTGMHDLLSTSPEGVLYYSDVSTASPRILGLSTITAVVLKGHFDPNISEEQPSQMTRTQRRHIIWRQHQQAGFRGRARRWRGRVT